MIVTEQRFLDALDGYLSAIFEMLYDQESKDCSWNLLRDAQLEATELLRIRSRLHLVAELKRPTSEDVEMVTHIHKLYEDMVPSWESAMKTKDKAYLAKTVNGAPVYNRGETDRARCSDAKCI